MKNEFVINLKIGRHEYKITEKDEFMDNGNCIQLLTQSKERIDWGKRSNPVLSKVAIKKISSLYKTSRDYEFGHKTKIFKLSLKAEELKSK